ncbi:MAG: aminopeptidase N [Pseudomonadales bacterium]|nr:aminopeptidase N [Pseudomonadales bacterium]
MKDAQPRAILLSEYRVPAFLVSHVDLHVTLGEDTTRVRSRLTIARNPACAEQAAPLRLNGQALALVSLALDGTPLAAQDYGYDGEELCIATVPDRFVLESEVELRPQDNTALEGLYRSRSMFCTQCEPEGFRRITFFPDRPDVLSLYSTTIVAGRARFPVLLSNGNRAAGGELDDGRHWVRWEDPFPKPCYLFALVAGDLACVEDSFVTQSGREVALRIFVEARDLDKCDFAMRSLKQAMRWDEEVYGREYDLDVFMIVAVDDFNMGAMENKGLNIFNTSAVLANPALTTDASFLRIAAIVAHEYFHNWSGNRVTCRDWFQLSLKEGFTVFRDAEFSADTGSRAVRRIENVNLLRTSQFAEDAGPMAHPVRPDSYIEINNFYTLTVYEKGAEVVRMIRELIGSEAFRRGSDLYFARHDGQAVTTEDFVRAMEEASGRELAQFRRWYTQAGTPVLNVRGDYDAARRIYRLTVAQGCPATPGQPHKEPFHVPLRMGLVGAAGDLPLRLAGDGDGPAPTERVLELTQPEHSFEFLDVGERPIPSLLRQFSAPVKLHLDYSRDDLAALMQRDSDGVARWDAGQGLAVQVLQEQIAARRAGEAKPLDSRLAAALRVLLADTGSDAAMIAQMLVLPGEAYLAELAETIEPVAIHHARTDARRALAAGLRHELLACYLRNLSGSAYRIEAADVARRSLKNACLAYLLLLDDEECRDLAYQQYYAQDNMTDVLAALTALVNSDSAIGQDMARELLADFHTRWHHEALAMNLWFQVQALRPGAATLDEVKRLRAHAEFDVRNPNKVRALLGAFVHSNPGAFHRADHGGYRFLGEQVASIDAMNPQVASRLITPLTRWRRYEPAYADGMRAVLKELLGHPGLSRDSFEVVSKSLA